MPSLVMLSLQFLHLTVIFYLDNPKSVTLTVPLPSTKQFLAAWGQESIMYVLNVYLDTCHGDISPVSHQVSVDVLLGLQVGHALRDVLAHLQQLDHRRVLLQPFPEVRQQAAVGEELGHDVNRSLFGAHPVQLDQVFMVELPGLSQKKS